MSTLNKVCFTTCMVTVVICALLALAMIWANIDPEIVGKIFLTLGVFFTSACVIAGVGAFFRTTKDK